ncbi:pre-peptidase C-terminal domain-containing protein [Hansschlegelia beijingensis]|uniref:pre-peptidase C-terminal domain-containing protein n=1 Tax=Hansschlegelia beijingensis TaxID=1133344 RepID=UPI00380584ED
MADRILTDNADVYTDDSGSFTGAVYGRGGDDELHGSYETALYGEDGSDTLYGGQARGLYGGAAADVLHQDYATHLHGGDGDDLLNGSIRPGILYGDAGNDTLRGGGTEHARPSAISLGSGVLTQSRNFGNHTLGTAVLLNETGFSLADDPNVSEATWTPHVTVTGVGAGAIDYYKITLNNPGSSILVDVDQSGLSNPVGDTVIALLDSGGQILALNNDCPATVGGGGSVDGRDSYLNYSFAAPGTYYIQIHSSAGALPVGQQYRFQLSTTEELGDVLDGGMGADRMEGGIGNQIYYVDDFGDKAIEANVTGHDTVFSSVSYSLKGQYVEALNLTGFVDVDATGNSLNNTLTGNSGVNVLTGKTGDDTYHVQTVGDRALEAKDEGSDAVFSTVSYSLAGQHIENLTLTGSANISATGNSLRNTISGNAGANVLDGGTGADTLAGGAGGDTYYVQNSGDKVVEANVSGVDTVFSSVSFVTTGQYIENVTLTGAANINVKGATLANQLIGNSGNNVINGWSNSDTLTGGGGGDTFAFSTALSASNVDVITDFDPVLDLIRLDDAVFKELVVGALVSDAFVAASAALDASDRIIYDQRAGALFFDRDGTGTTYAAVRFATIENHAAMTAADFTVI